MKGALIMHLKYDYEPKQICIIAVLLCTVQYNSVQKSILNGHQVVPFCILS